MPSAAGDTECVLDVMRPSSSHRNGQAAAAVQRRTPAFLLRRARASRSRRARVRPILVGQRMGYLRAQERPKRGSDAANRGGGPARMQHFAAGARLPLARLSHFFSVTPTVRSRGVNSMRFNLG